MDELKEEHRAAVALALAGKSKGEIAETLKCDRVTVWRWFQRTDVKAELLRQQRDICEQAVQILRAGATEAAETVRSFARGEYEDRKGAGLQLEAAKILLTASGALAFVHEPDRPVSMQETASRIAAIYGLGDDDDTETPPTHDA